MTGPPTANAGNYFFSGAVVEAGAETGASFFTVCFFILWCFGWAFLTGTGVAVPSANTKPEVAAKNPKLRTAIKIFFIFVLLKVEQVVQISST